jgi:mRNA interferase RelE/StbE
MNNYQIFWKKSAIKDLKSLPGYIARKITEVVENLQTNPRPEGARKLELLTHHYRLRIGDYRIVYSVQDNILVIEIIKIGHRKDIYKGF